MQIRQFYWKVPDYDQPVGKLIYDITKNEYTIEVFNVERRYLPLSLIAIVDNNRNPLTGKLAMQWIQCRVEPPDRANIRDILECAGMSTYDEFGLLVYHRGRATYDKLYLEEIV